MSDKTIPLDDNENATLPVLDVLAGRGAIFGKSGSGKSNSASVVIEELLDHGHPCLIVDTDGEYWGLKQDYELLHVGADDECDLQVGSEHGGKLAELTLEQGVPIILDVSGYLQADEAAAVVRETVLELFHREKRLERPFLLVVEEIHEYIPEGGGLDDTGEALIRVAKRGRKRGLGILGISQRPANVKKDFITQCDWLLWHRLTWQNDVRTARDHLDDRADDIDDLADGAGYLAADFRSPTLEHVQLRRKRTYDAGARPDLDTSEQPTLKSVNNDLVDELEAISEHEQQRQDEIGGLEDRVDELEGALEEKDQELEQAQQMRDLAKQMAESLKHTGDADADEVASEQVDELVEERNALEQRVADREADIEQLRDRVSELEEYERRVEQLDALDLDEAEEAVQRLATSLGLEADGDSEKWRSKYQHAKERAEELEQRAEELEAVAKQSDPAVTAPDEYDEFTDDEWVQEAIDDAMSEENVTPRYVKGVVASVRLRGGPASRREVANDLGVDTTEHVRAAMKALEERGVVERAGSGDDGTADFAFDNLERIHEQQARRQRVEQEIEEF
jgi:hypothetical protein